MTTNYAHTCMYVRVHVHILVDAMESNVNKKLQACYFTTEQNLEIETSHPLEHAK